MNPALLLSGLAVCEASRVGLLDSQLSTDLGDHGGVIRVGDGSRCLDVYGDNIHASKVTIYAAVCNGDKGQVWKHEGGALKNVASGRCLDIEGASTHNGANLILFKCNGHTNQQFQFNKASNSIFQPKSSKCLDVDMASNIKNVLLWSCKSSQNQKMDWAAEWSLSQASETLKVDGLLDNQLSTDLGDHGGVIRVGDGSRCLDVYGDNIHASKVTIYAAVCNGDKGQVWKHEGGALKNVASDRCLDIEGASTHNGANLILFKCNGHTNQQFQFNKASNSIFQPKSSKCLDVDMASNIKNVLLWSCKNSQNQKMDWAAEWSLSQASETLKVDNEVSTDEVNEEVGSYPKRGDTVRIEWVDSKDFTKAPGEMCSDADRRILYQHGWKGKPDDSKHGGFPAAMDACGREGYSFWHNTFTLKDFETCVKNSAYRELSNDCVKCISIGPAYGALNCKSACATNACSKNCVACNQASGAYIHKCSAGGTATSYCPKGWAKHPPKGCNDPKEAINADGSINPLPARCASGNE